MKNSALSPQLLASTLSNYAMNPYGEVPVQAIKQAAEEAARKARRAADPIETVSMAASRSELANARRRGAIRRGNDVYLPQLGPLTSVLPNLLLRSSLWSMRVTRHDDQVVPSAVRGLGDGAGGRLGTFGGSTLINKGLDLGGYDRRVFTACLDYYRDERPLSKGESGQYVEVSFFKLLKAQGKSYHLDSHRALRASLERLSTMSLYCQLDGFDLDLPRILEVSFADSGARGEVPQASDRIHFRVFESFANMYARAKWTAVPHAALDAGIGLKSWLTCFYATHSKPFPLKLEELHHLTGSTAKMWRFRAQLKESLEALKELPTGNEQKVDHCDMKGNTVTVHMAKWSA